MSDFRRVLTPLGWLEVLITVQETIELQRLGLTQSNVYISGDETDRIFTVPIIINEPQLVSLKPGGYKIYARFGEIFSESLTIYIVSGATEKINFHFGEKDE